MHAVWSCYYSNSSGYEKIQQSAIVSAYTYVHLQSLISNFGQQCLNGVANRSAANDGQVLPNFEQILSGAWMLPCPIAAVILIPLHSILCWLVVSPQEGLPGFRRFPSKRINHLLSTILGGQYFIFLFHQSTEQPHQGNMSNSTSTSKR
jgi:hypothetical protein